MDLRKARAIKEKSHILHLWGSGGGTKASKFIVFFLKTVLDGRGMPDARLFLYCVISRWIDVNVGTQMFRVYEQNCLRWNNEKGLNGEEFARRIARCQKRQ